ncbi:hypothetical protein JDV02_010174 [Purpureocillium takamizusanense]|uniref:Ubiquitin-like domain-containing protein n=1 Tax=Purpureocillium takamizusanense TaxID=2060973 RepID=A0A9Q8QRA8_9HYPO|nr:uncharacterized protein JDV02_010174 [Purpureocillium takamizusanense]UNI24430.1 hypothetical protein JDV02_010174 [Purpureocillium takamizusanense]
MTSAPIAINAGLTPPEQLVVNLQVVSPSVGVNRPLLFPDLPSTTTIKQLKHRIRDALPLRPADENQRLIHRGRALLRDSESLLDIFGADVLRTPDRQTIHLVIRETTDTHTPTPPNAARASSSRPRSQSPQVGPDGLPRIQVSHSAIPLQGHRGPSPAPPHAYNVPPQYTHEQAAAFQHQHQNMTNWLTQVQRDAHLQREAMFRARVSQNQRGRAQMGMRGIGDQGTPNGTASGQESASGRASPNAYLALQNEVAARVYAGQPSADPQGIFRSQGDNRAPTDMAHALHRTASGTSLHTLHNRQFFQPGVTTPAFGYGSAVASNGRITPDHEARWAEAARAWASADGSGVNAANSSGSANVRASSGSQVYILMSPEGPRAILFNPSTSETYFTPRLRSQQSWPYLSGVRGPVNAASGAQQLNLAQNQTQDRGHNPHPEPPAPANVQQPLQPVHPGNPPAAGLPPLLLQLWPHMWLIFRLGLFVWFFTSPDSSWSRWLTIICMAVFAFVLSTGLLNGVAENAWRPIGRHIENILPALEHPRGVQRIQRGDDREPNPEQMAARLVADRRGREGWLTGQVRRLERAGLLFLASIAPGVAERHIANLEAEARAEENRQREAEAAAAAQAAAATAAAAPDDDDAQGEARNGGENDTNTHDNE